MQIYVKPSPTRGEGTHASPYGNLHDAFQAARAGDIVLLLGGIYDKPVTGVLQGSKEAPITITTEDPDGVTIRAPWRLQTSSHVELLGLTWRDLPNEVLIFGEATHHCRVANCQFLDAHQQGCGASCHGVSNPYGVSILLEGPHATDNVFEGNRLIRKPRSLDFWCEGFNTGHGANENYRCTIRGNEVAGYTYGIQIGWGSEAGYHLVEDNIVHDCSHDGIHDKASFSIIRRNHVYNQPNGAIMLRCGRQCLVADNRIHNCSYGIRVQGESHLIRDNLIYDITEYGMILFGHSLGGPAQDTLILHNTFSDNGLSRGPIPYVSAPEGYWQDHFKSSNSAIPANLPKQAPPEEHWQTNGIIAQPGSSSLIAGNLFSGQSVPVRFTQYNSWFIRSIRCINEAWGNKGMLGVHEPLETNHFDFEQPDPDPAPSDYLVHQTCFNAYHGHAPVKREKVGLLDGQGELLLDQDPFVDRKKKNFQLRDDCPAKGCLPEFVHLLKKGEDAGARIAKP